jgi:hypothetical protein
MKILFQIQGPGSQTYTGVWGTLVKMWREEGWRGFMRGNGTNCIRIVPYSASQFAAYTTYKRVTPLISGWKSYAFSKSMYFGIWLIPCLSY